MVCRAKASGPVQSYNLGCRLTQLTWQRALEALELLLPLHPRRNSDSYLCSLLNTAISLSNQGIYPEHTGRRRAHSIAPQILVLAQPMAPPSCRAKLGLKRPRVYFTLWTDSDAQTMSCTGPGSYPATSPEQGSNYSIVVPTVYLVSLTSGIQATVETSR